jgi:hypothetical protein
VQITIANALSPRFSDNFTVTDPPENVVVTIYQWFNGLQYSEKEILFKGMITSPIKYDEYTCTLTIRGIFNKYNKQIGADKIITPALFPDADPDEYGKISNIIYGAVEDVPCNAIVAGDVNSIVSDITASQTTIELSDASYFPASGVIGIDAEKISYTGNNGTVLSGCTRGYNSTTPVVHSAGAAAWEILSVYVYMVAGHPVKAIGDIFCDKIRITPICTKYTGQPGNVLAGYAGLAVFTVPSMLSRQQAINLLISDGISINDATAVVDTIAVNDGISVVDGITITDGVSVSDTIAVADTIGVSTGDHYHTESTNPIFIFGFDTIGTFSNVTAPEMLIDGNQQTQALFSAGGSAQVKRSAYQEGAGTIYKIRACLVTGSSVSGTITFDTVTGTAPMTTYKTAWYTPGTNANTWAKLNALIITVTSTGAADVCGVWWEVQMDSSSAATGVAKTGSATKSGTVTKSGSVSKSGSATKSGTATKTGAASKTGTVTRSGAVTLSGNSVANVQIGQLITANVNGYQDDASGTYTGTANFTVEYN